MSAVWGRYLKPWLTRMFWLVAALFFSSLAIPAQVREGEWKVSIVRSPMGDRSYAVASAPAASTFHGERPRLVIACEVVRNGESHGLNVFVDLGTPYMLAEHFKERGQPLTMTAKLDDGTRITGAWHQSETFRELFHDAKTEAEQRSFVKRMAESKRVMIEVSADTDKTDVFGFTTTGLQPYVPILAQACGWHK